MRVGIVSWESKHSIAVGGVAAHVSELAAALARLGVEVHIVTRLGAGQRAYKFIDGVHYHRCAYDSRPDFISDIDNMCGAFVDKLWQIEDFSGPFDVIHGHDWLTTKAAVWARKGRGKRVVMTFHSTEYGRCGNYFREDGLSHTIRSYEWEAQYEADALIAVSNALRGEVIRIYATPPDKICTIFNGVDPHRFDGFIDQGHIKMRCGIGPLEPMVLFCGRLTGQKGPDLLMEGIPQALRERPDAKFIFAGEGDMRPWLEDRAGQINAAHAVRFLGFKTGVDLVNIYRAADIVCVPSRNEPFGIVILEAWASGKPVVATNDGGPGELIWHGVTGLKVAKTPGSISNALGYALSDLEYARWMGGNGRAAAETAFSWDQIARRTINIYEGVC